MSLDFFFFPQAYKIPLETSPSTPLDTNKINIIFSNVETLYSLNKMLLSRMEAIFPDSNSINGDSLIGNCFSDILYTMLLTRPTVTFLMLLYKTNFLHIC
eukprot:TRINITY_DN4084_c0_g2_i2.p1 TRINITY_DN4084_c0_g2~~TRINITY_DN4084_c0_g2_i2.p1  ORF type:complete len:100 (-),score=8.88 TRINITY_DN4084_c0_g2_i2:492-791(-)